MLLKNENQIIRVLKSHGDKALVIDCIKRTMPKWVDGDSLSNYDDCGEDEMYERTDYFFGRELSPKEERIAQERFTMIAGVLPYIGNEQKRNQMIDFLAEHQSKQTIRKYLCLYLVYQDIDALAPPPRTEKKLNQDEKNMRWALNKFFYTKQKNSLMTAYTLMLKEKYCDSLGQLVAVYPTFDQFRYFYRKTKKMQQYYISRDGIKDYQRNNRPLLGDGVQQFAPVVGVGMLDSTICDIYLVDDGSKLVGRPVLCACVDAFSGLCCGYSLGWEGGTYSLRSLMLNVIANKQEWCESHGVFIDDGEWDSNKLPGVFVTDIFDSVDKRKSRLNYSNQKIKTLLKITDEEYATLDPDRVRREKEERFERKIARNERDKEIISLYQHGVPKKEIARRFDISKKTVQRKINEHQERQKRAARDFIGTLFSISSSSEDNSAIANSDEQKMAKLFLRSYKEKMESEGCDEQLNREMKRNGDAGKMEGFSWRIMGRKFVEKCPLPIKS